MTTDHSLKIESPLDDPKDCHCKSVRFWGSFVTQLRCHGDFLIQPLQEKGILIIPRWQWRKVRFREVT